jgi:ATP-dependent protease HslVU (ClpYQ) peptidase subunit
LKERLLTVCIAAASNDGRFVVTATDGQLTFGEITADVMLGKRVWFDDWQCMYAGEPANCQMIFEEMHTVHSGQPLTRENIKTVMLAAYRKRMSASLSASVLAPYDLSMDEFKKDGLSMFGEREFTRLSQLLEDHAYQYRDQLLIVGWGKTIHANMIYKIEPHRDRDYKYEGIAAIGSGEVTALSTMLLLGQSRQTLLVDTLYNVAAAKFSAEKSYDRDVGQHTSMFVQWKRTDDDDDGLPGKWITDIHVDRLRALWEEHGRPRFPEEARKEIYDIIGESEIKTAVRDQIKVMVSMSQSKMGKPQKKRKPMKRSQED